jgi:signal transduction histidine kinase
MDAVPPQEAARLSLLRESAGSGLGLAIARGLAELHDGSLIATDAPGAGARFVLSVPLRSGPV